MTFKNKFRFDGGDEEFLMFWLFLFVEFDFINFLVLAICLIIYFQLIYCLLDLLTKVTLNTWTFLNKLQVLNIMSNPILHGIEIIPRINNRLIQRLLLKPPLILPQKLATNGAPNLSYSL